MVTTLPPLTVEAIPLFDPTQADMERVLGANHRDTLVVGNRDDEGTYVIEPAL
jgi:hypothetical protein